MWLRWKCVAAARSSSLSAATLFPDESHRLIETVHFQADLVAIPQPTSSEINKTAQLLMGIAGIVIVGGSAAILLGFFLGGGRALYRIARGKPASSMYDEDFIQHQPAGEMGREAQPREEPEPEGLTSVSSLWKNRS